MKKIELQNPLIVLLILGFFLSCQSSADSAEQIEINESEFAIKSSYDNDIIGQYLRIKDALVATDAEEAANAAKNLKDILLNKKNLILLSHDSSNMNFIIEEIIDNKDIKSKRVSFYELSKSLIKEFKNKSIETKEDQDIYIQFCPMAMNNKGAIWLSAEYNVLNPYYGETMLKCGVVRDTI
jgi:Cu(I)/Ag(I) efflux system membrane fusion protein